jgi:hypothetical protein
MNNVLRFVIFAAFFFSLYLLSPPARSQSGSSWTEGFTVSFENITPTETIDPTTGMVRYPQCGDVISGTVVLTNWSPGEISYSRVEVSLAIALDTEPYTQIFPKPYRTIASGETQRFPFSLKTTRKTSGNYRLLGTVSFPEWAMDSHNWIDYAYSKSAQQNYRLECGAAAAGNKRTSLIDQWSELSGWAKAFWLAVGGFLAWSVWRMMQIAKMDNAVSELMKTGKNVDATGLIGGNNQQPKIVTLPGGELCFQVPLDVCTDGTGPAADGEPTHVKTTSMGYINADSSNYIVLTGDNWFTKFGIQKGDVALVMYRGKMTGAVFAEVGQDDKLGEASVSALESVGGLSRKPNGLVSNIATPHAATVIVIPKSGDHLPRGRPKYVPEGTPVEKTNFPTNAEINAVAFAHARRLGLLPAEPK